MAGNYGVWQEPRGATVHLTEREEGVKEVGRRSSFYQSTLIK